MIQRTDILITPDPSRVLIRFFSPGSSERRARIIGRVMALDDKRVKERLETVCERFGSRHRDVEEVFLRHYEVVEPHLLLDVTPSRERQLLIGAYFTSEFALECAALFNPSIVPHPDQSGLDAGKLRFVLSLRATGEGHVSSLEFREGIIDSNGIICLECPGDLVMGPEIVENPSYEKEVFSSKLYELGYDDEITNAILEKLGDEFTLTELKARIKESRTSVRSHDVGRRDALNVMIELAEHQYGIRFNCARPLAERVIFPRVDHNRKAIEDARFVRFTDDDGEVVYYATYTAYDGKIFFPQLLRTKDFCSFRFITLNGDAVEDKGMALFPRKINGRYAMISRQDGENIYVMFSDHLHFWHEAQLLMKPKTSWEYVQLGNCGSPIETSEGWLLLTHGVGPMRRYCIGAALLDLDDPTRVIGRLTEPLLEPDENEREGYVPNVVYTCGALIHEGMLVVPYAMADYATRIAIVDLAELLRKLKQS